MAFEVPAVDISPWVTDGSAPDRQQVAAAVDHACSTVGFMQILGHGVPDDVIAGLARAVDGFFGLPAEVKNSYRVDGANRGYSPPKSESLSLSLGVESSTRMNDFFEAFNVGVEARSFVDLDLDEADYGIVTVLWADQVAGLQVLGTDRRWHDVAPIDGALLVNLGDLTARITNDYWMSTLHRVKPPIVDGSIKRRRSAAYFHDGNVDAVITTAARFLDADAGLAYEPVTVGEHIANKLAGSRQGKLNVAAVREAARVAQANDART